MHPAAYGVPLAARSAVHQLRRDRNKALHGVEPAPSTPHQVAVTHSEYHDEEIFEEIFALPEHAAQSDPLMNCPVTVTDKGTMFSGHIQSIWVDSLSGERLYKVVYSDGDIQHLTKAEALEARAAYNSCGVGAP